jgi:hypothetical protein
MGTENQRLELNIQDEQIFSGFEQKNIVKTHQKPELAKKCVCGCNVPILYAKRNCQNPFSTPRNNFREIVTSFFKEDMPESIVSENQAIDLYDLFHIILQVRRQLGRISWRKVAKALGASQSTSEFRRPLRRFYKTKLKAFEAWLQEKGPVSIGCIDTSLVIIILKEFLPKIEKPKPESPKSTFPSPSRAEVDKDIYEVMESLLGNVETYGIPVKKRKIREELAEFDEPFEEDPIFVVRSLNPKIKKRVNEKADKSKTLNSAKENTLEKKKEDLKEKSENKLPVIEKKQNNDNLEKLKKQGKNNLELKEAGKDLINEKVIVKDEQVSHRESIEPLPVPNPMTNEFRRRDPVSMGYRTDFRRGYLPIEMQEEHEKQEKVQQEKESKAHFIRKKQSAVNIKRSCGVTYVKPTESKQRGVTHEFPPLPPLAFQVGTVDRLIPSEEKPKFFSLANDLISDLFKSGHLFRVTIQTDYSEEDLKNYILGKKNDGEEIFLDDLSELWRLLAKDAFVVIHLRVHPKCLFIPAGPGETGDCKIGILVKKGLCGTRSVKRCLGLPDVETDPLNMYATQLRLELYVTRPLWKKSLKDTQKLLCAFIGELEVFMQKFLVTWNDLRSQVFTSKQVPSTSHCFKLKNSCNCPKNKTEALQGFWEYKTSVRSLFSQTCSSCSAVLFEIVSGFQVGLSNLCESKSSPNWFYLINTRDSFSYDLKVKKTYIGSGVGRITKKEYMFHKDDLPSNYKDWEKYCEGDYVKTGVVTFKNCFSHQTLLDLEQEALKTEKDFLAGRFIKNTAQPTFGGKGKIKRTKFFFGTRYLWTSAQLAEKQSRIAAGVRVDVSATPQWMKEKIEKPLVQAGIVEKGFINSIAMNIYHDGKEGLAQHFDDAVRFKQPIFTVKLDSDSRLSFGSQFYGYLNGAFCIPCPRGAVCMLEEFSYAANSAKHCVRPCDLAGRSITVILRQIHPFIMEEARRFDAEVDLPTWFSTLSLRDDAVPYAEQKEMDTKIMMKGSSLPKAGY